MPPDAIECGILCLGLSTSSMGEREILESLQGWKVLATFAPRKPQEGSLRLAVVAQLVEHQLPKLRVTSSSLAYRSCSGDAFRYRGVSPSSLFIDNYYINPLQ